MNIKQAYNFIQVNNQLSCSGLLKNISLQSLLDEGYKVVINLLPNDDPHALEGEKEGIENLDLHYVHIPIDWSEPKESDFKRFESSVNEYKNDKIHIHCAANYRVTAFYAVYAYKNLGWSSSQVDDFIDSIWDISEHPVWGTFVSSNMAS